MVVTASKLRENVKTGEPVEIIRGGRKLKIVPAEEPRTRKLDRTCPGSAGWHAHL
jgi:antitoxin (DNA-binding transcriptional repressor) of toxin-antitoxin stability system